MESTTDEGSDSKNSERKQGRFTRAVVIRPMTAVAAIGPVEIAQVVDVEDHRATAEVAEAVVVVETAVAGEAVAADLRMAATEATNLVGPAKIAILNLSKSMMRN